MKVLSSVNLINHKPLLSTGVKFKGQDKVNQQASSETNEDSKSKKILWYGISIPVAIIAGLSFGFLGPKLPIFAPPQSMGSSVSSIKGESGHVGHSVIKGELVSEQYKGRTFTALKTKDGTYILQEGDTLSKRYFKLKAKGKIQPGKNVLVSGHVKPATTKDGTPIPGAPNIFYVEDMKLVWF